MRPGLGLPALSLTLSLTLPLAAAACGTPATPATATPATVTATPASPTATSPAILEARRRAAARFQDEFDAELRAAPNSMLTAVAGHYLAPGESLNLGYDASAPDGAWSRGGEPVLARFVNTPEGVQVTLDGAEQTLTERAILTYAGVTDSDSGDARWRFELSVQSQRWRVLVHDSQARARARFEGIDWYPIDPLLVAQARFEPAPARTPIELQTSRGEAKTLYTAGVLRFALPDHAPGEALALTVFGYAPSPPPEGALEPVLIPFRDATTGDTSYGAGRYLELELPAVALELPLDFNRATNPLCARSPHYNCPFAPGINELLVAIQAGAMTPPEP